MTTEQAREGAQPLKVSVIVPVHNVRRTLESCLSAIAASSYPNYECIVADDSSTDDTREIAARYATRVLELTGGPLGPAYARNRGWR